MRFRAFSFAVAALVAWAPAALAQSSDVDYANAKPFPLPMTKVAPTSVFSQKAGASMTFSPQITPGRKGDGERENVSLPKSNFTPAPDSGSDTVTSQEYGLKKHPFTTAIEKRPDADPYRRAGKLFFKQGADTYICSASMIGRGIVITAAHCVSDFGKNKYYSGFRYIPAYSGGDAPYGVWTAAKVIAPATYLSGKSKCSNSGIICTNDIAIIVLKPNSKKRYAGDATGYFSYGTDGYGYTSEGITQITQLGYPGSLNRGEEMMRTDSFGFVDKNNVNNTVIGSAQTGGSSGGPWIVNFGFAPSNDSSNPDGTDAARMVVVGATSWGYGGGGAPSTQKEQGASFFTASILKDLITKACKFDKNACK